MKASEPMLNNLGQPFVSLSQMLRHTRTLGLIQVSVPHFHSCDGFEGGWWQREFFSLNARPFFEVCSDQPPASSIQNPEPSITRE
jgi:hypothetical protein